MPGRLIAIGDMHGCLAAVSAILEKIAPTPEDTLVTLGDYVDRGPDSRGVLDLLIRLQKKYRLVPILGNHDEIFLDICEGRHELIPDWLTFGGDATLESYGNIPPTEIPPEHLDFLRSCILLYETEGHFFTHGSYEPVASLDEQRPRLLLWGKLRPLPPAPHYSGKIAIVGHTAQRDGKILDLGHVKCIDTCCYGDGCLTALDIASGKVWQADKKGKFKK